MFSLYPGDLVKLVKGSGKEIVGYYIGSNRATASITIDKHDKSEVYESQGIKTLDKIEKYVIDVLGNYHKVKHEKRLPLSQ